MIYDNDNDYKSETVSIVRIESPPPASSRTDAAFDEM